MKKMMIALVAMLMIAASGKAMSYEQARNEALFLTDKMAYELNLTDEQYEAAYEINLDYLMGVTSYDDVYATYWERRNLDMSYILLDWQWNAFCAATYFYRPLYWEGGYWHFGIYARYPHRDYFYFGRPVFYASYRGGHAWHCVGGRGYYYGRRSHFHHIGHSHFGMLDRWNRGDFRHNHHYSGHHRTYGGNRISSTRTTVNNNRSLGNRNSYSSGRNFGSRNYSSNTDRQGSRSTSSSTYRNNGNSSTYNGRNYSSSASFGGRSSSGRSSSFGSSRNSSSYGSSHSSGSFSGSRSSSSYGSSRSSGSFGGSRSSSSYGSSRGSGSFGGSRSSGSFSSSRSSSGGHSSSGGRTFGGRR